MDIVIGLVALMSALFGISMLKQATKKENPAELLLPLIITMVSVGYAAYLLTGSKFGWIMATTNIAVVVIIAIYAVGFMVNVGINLRARKIRRALSSLLTVVMLTCMSLFFLNIATPWVLIVALIAGVASLPLTIRESRLEMERNIERELGLYGTSSPARDANWASNDDDALLRRIREADKMPQRVIDK